MSPNRQRDFQLAPEQRDPARRPIVDASLAEVLAALVQGRCLAAVVPIALAHVERDLMRGLMEVPGAFWGRRPRLYDRYREALRQSAALRRRLPPEERMKFWSPLVLGEDQ